MEDEEEELSCEMPKMFRREEEEEDGFDRLAIKIPNPVRGVRP